MPLAVVGKGLTMRPRLAAFKLTFAAVVLLCSACQFSLVLATNHGPNANAIHNLKGMPAAVSKRGDSSRKLAAHTTDKQSTSSVDTSSLQYHGGTVLSQPKTIYPIFYGAFDTTTIERILFFLFSTFNSTGATGSPTVADWWNVLQSYYGYNNAAVNQAAEVSSYQYSTYDVGTSITLLDVYSILLEGSFSATGAADSNGIYLLITGTDITVDACTLDCIVLDDYEYSTGSFLSWTWLGGASCSQCDSFTTYSAPDSDSVGDNIILQMSAALPDIVTNPYSDGWYNNANQSISAFCGGTSLDPTFQAAYKASKTDIYGVGGLQFLVQGIWDESKKTCSYGTNSGVKMFRSGMLVLTVALTALLMVL